MKAMTTARIADRALFSVAILAGAALRVVPAWLAVFPGGLLAAGKVHFLGNDSYYHLHRIQDAVRRFPAVIEFDPWINFPEGARIIWPQGFDLMLAAGARLLPHPSHAAVERLCALAIPLLGVAAIAAVYAFARAALREPGAGAAALAFALLPYPMAYSLLGYVDHHVMEPFFLAASAAMLLASLRRAGPAAWALGAGAGAAAALSCVFVPDGLAIVFLGGVVATWEGARGRFPGARGAAIAALATATMVLVALAASTPWGRSGEMTYLALSPLHVHLAIAGSSLALAVIFAAWRPLPAGLRLLGAAGGVALAAGALAHGGTPLLDQLREASRFLLREDAIAATVGESKPLWNKSPGYLALRIGPIGLVTPFVLAYAAVRDRAKPAGTGALLALAIFALGMIQMRFMVMGAIGIAWTAGWLVARAWAAAEAEPARPWLKPAALAALAVALLYPHVRRPIDAAQLAPGADQFALAGELQALARSSSGAATGASGAPPWGVLAPWDMGHLLVYEANAPVIACPFGQAPWHVEGVRREVRFGLSPSDDEAAALCREFRARYVVTSDPFSRILSNTRILGVPSNRYVARVAGAEEGTEALPDFVMTVGFRLHLFDGAATTAGIFEIPAAPHFRLVWESLGFLERDLRIPGTRDVRPSTYKLFEVVEGARVRGHCAPGRPVRLRVTARTNVRSFEWVNEAPCRNRRFEMLVPYSSTHARISQGGGERLISVSEAQVREGVVVSADVDGS